MLRSVSIVRDLIYCTMSGDSWQKQWGFLNVRYVVFSGSSSPLCFIRMRVGGSVITQLSKDRNLLV